MKRLLTAAVLAVTACSGGSDRVIIGAGTTLVDSGFIDAIAAEYEAATGNDVSVIGESSQRLFDLARRGEVDLLLTHEPEALAAFVAEGSALDSVDVLTSRFLLLGPAGPALNSNQAGAVFREISQRRLPFVSRADGSGTYLQELAFWDLAGVAPSGDWYDTTGQGMGLTMQVADQRRAFVVAEEGAWLDARDGLSLVEVNLAGDWPNIYTSTVVAGPAAAAAEGFHRWLTSAEGTAAVIEINERLFGAIVYRPE